jgi:hypothetical protein
LENVYDKIAEAYGNLHRYDLAYRYLRISKTRVDTLLVKSQEKIDTTTARSTGYNKRKQELALVSKECSVKQVAKKCVCRLLGFSFVDCSLHVYFFSSKTKNCFDSG